MRIDELHARRRSAGIAGNILSVKVGMSRSRLSDIERGHIQPRTEEVVRIAEALDDIIRAKERLSQAARELGVPALVR